MGSLRFYRDPIRLLRSLGMTEQRSHTAATQPWDDGRCSEGGGMGMTEWNEG